MAFKAPHNEPQPTTPCSPGPQTDAATALNRRRSAEQQAHCGLSGQAGEMREHIRTRARLHRARLEGAWEANERLRVGGDTHHTPSAFSTPPSLPPPP